MTYRPVLHSLAVVVAVIFFGCIPPAALVNCFIISATPHKASVCNHHSKTTCPPSFQRLLAIPIISATFTEKNNDNNPEDPETWYDDLPPEKFAVYFKRDDVSEEVIQELLQTNNINNLQDMKDRGSDMMVDYMKKKLIVEAVLILEAALNRSRKTPEKVLGGEVNYDPNCISKDSFNVYSANAVSVKPIEIAPLNIQTRNNEFSLVLGPSGSGKTLFALRRLPQLACSINLKECFRVHFKSNTVASVMDATNMAFPEAATYVVQQIVQAKLPAGRKDIDDVLSINLYLHVTIDEAGLEYTKECFGSAVDVLRIVDALKAMPKFRFTKGVHVTLAGTGLEEITSRIVSETEATKFRMKPWTEVQFHALLDASSHPQPNLLKEAVQKFSILKKLITNARCSFFIVNLTTATSFLEDVLVRGYVRVLVSTVANAYITSNGMKSLVYPKEKWEVCRSVWRQLDMAISQRGVPFFPRFDDLENETIRNAARLLIDVHVELKAGQPGFADETFSYALSVSPAIAIVMARLLNAKAELSWDWESFETVVMLGELKHLVANSDDIPSNPDRPLIELKSPLPQSSSSKTFSVPIVNRYSVVLNGPKAAYADVIAPYRLVQAKFTNDGPTGTINLNLTGELDKMGLLITDDNNCALQQKLTSSFYQMWETLEAVPPSAARSVPFESTFTDQSTRSESYPYNTLSTPESVEEPAVLLYDARSMKFVFGKEDADRLYSKQADRDALVALVKTLNETAPLMEFNESRPISAVFATNGACFRVPKSNWTEAFSVGREDVDWQGILVTDSTPEFANVVAKLRKFVNIRFQFY